MLKLEHIQKSFDGVHILNDLSLDIPNGEIVSILEPSGSGKTTLLNLILGITDIDSGRILFNDQDITDVPMEQRGFNIVFQDYALFPNLTAYENITYGLKNKPHISSPEEVQELVHLLGLEKHLNKRIDQLSGGQKQRVAAARAIVTHPKLILADEPTGALDSKSAKMLLESLETLNNSMNATIMMVTHDAFTASYAKRILFIKDGKIFNELIRGNDSRKEFFSQIIEVVSLLGGDQRDVF